jgi:hypothetical protein
MSALASVDLVDPMELASRVFCPQRPAIAAALECVYAMPAASASEAAAGGVSWDEKRCWICWKSPDGSEQRFRADLGHFDAEQAWEALVSHGLVNEDWLSDESRSFLTTSLHRAKLDAGMSPKRLRHPHTLKSCVLAAADMAALASVESLTREACAALEPWGLPRVARSMLWQFDDPPAYGEQTFLASDRDARPRAQYVDELLDPWLEAVAVRATPALMRASAALGAVDASARKTSFAQREKAWSARHAKLAFVIATDAARWRAAAKAGRAVAAPVRDPEFPSSLIDVAFSALPNPFAPLATVYALGYGLSSIEEELRFVAVEA